VLGSATDGSRMPIMCDAIASLSLVSLFYRRGGKKEQRETLMFFLPWFVVVVLKEEPKVDHYDFGLFPS